MMRLMALFLNERIFSLTLKFLPFFNVRTCFVFASLDACVVTYVEVRTSYSMSMRSYAHARIN